VLLGEVADQLLDQHGLAHAGAAEQPDLPAARVRGQQVHHLDAGLEELARGRQVLHRRRGTVDRPALLGLHRVALVDRLTEQVEQTPERGIADRHRDRPTGVHRLGAPLEAIGGAHRDGAHAVVAEMLLHLADERSRAAVARRAGAGSAGAVAAGLLHLVELTGDLLLVLPQVVGYLLCGHAPLRQGQQRLAGRVAGRVAAPSGPLYGAQGGHLDLERGVDLRQLAGERGLHHDAGDLLHPPEVALLLAALGAVLLGPALLLCACFHARPSFVVLGDPPRAPRLRPRPPSAPG
jgi:hypothetical protein